MNTSDQIGEISAALAKAQGQIKGAIKDAMNPHYKNAYADLASVWEACRAALSANGLAVVQTMDVADGMTVLVTQLVHSSGQWFRSVYPIQPIKPDPQGYGSAITYARRYSLAAMVGVAPADDDGEAASGRGAPAPKRGGWNDVPASQGAQAFTGQDAAQDWVAGLLNAFGKVGVSRPMIERKYGVRVEELTDAQCDELQQVLPGLKGNPRAKTDFFGKAQSAAADVNQRFAPDNVEARQ